jgi:hypothetical protein
VPAGTATWNAVACDAPAAMGPKSALAGCAVQPSGAVTAIWPLAGPSPKLASVSFTETVSPATAGALSIVVISGEDSTISGLRSSTSESVVDTAPPLAVTSMRKYSYSPGWASLKGRVCGCHLKVSPPRSSRTSQLVPSLEPLTTQPLGSLAASPAPEVSV